MTRQHDPLDAIAIVYGLALAIVIGALVSRTMTGLALLLVNLGVGLVALSALPRLRARRGVARFLGVTFPLLVFYLYYRETAVVLSQPGIGWLDELVAGVELRAWESVGSDPRSQLLGELFALAYMSYVPLLLVTAVALLRLPDRGQVRPAESFVRRVCVAWGICYILFIIVPVLGPRFALLGVQEARMGAGPFSFVARLNQDHGMVRGAAFPSAHVAATGIALYSVWHCRRPWFWTLLPIGIGLAIGAVYLGYHYIIDVVLGIFIGGVAIVIDQVAFGHRGRSWRWLPAWVGFRGDGAQP